MAETNGSGKFKIAFYILTVIVGLAIPSIVRAVVDNDRIRACEDQKLADKIEFRAEALRAEFKGELKDLSNKMDIALLKLARIEERQRIE